MKKIICAIVALLLLYGMAAGAQENQTNGELKVKYRYIRAVYGSENWIEMINLQKLIDHKKEQVDAAQFRIQTFVDAKERPAKDRIFAILAEIPLEGKLSPAEEALNATLKTLRENNESEVSFLELVEVNKGLTGMREELVALRSVADFAERASGFSAALVFISLLGIYLFARHNRR